MKNENLVNICADSLIYLLEDVLTKPYLSLSEKEDAVRTAAEERIPAYFHRLLCGTGTDGILLNVNYDLSYIPVPGFDTAWQRADGTPIAYDAPDCVDHWGRLYVTAHQCGVDPFRYAMDAIRKEGGEVWFSVRMNDYHYLRIPNAVCTFWTEHPEYRVSENGVFDFAHPEVREYYKEYICTLCREYAIDGLEWDMMRGSTYFAGRVTAEKEEILTEYLRVLHDAVQAIAREKQRETLIYARVYSDIPANRGCGFAIPKWTQSGAAVVDGLILSNFHNPTDFAIPFADWQAWIGNPEIPLLAGCDFAAACIAYNNPLRRSVRMDGPAVKGFVAANHALGAHGFYQFNLFMTAGGTAQICTPAEAEKGERRHILTFRDPGEPGVCPNRLMPGESRMVSLPLGRIPQKGSASVLIGCTENAPVSIAVNGVPVPEYRRTDTSSVYENAAVSYTVVERLEEVAPYFQRTQGLLRLTDGENQITIGNPSADPQSVLWVEVDIDAACIG